MATQHEALPVELLIAIFQHLEWRDFESCSRVSWLFREVTLPRLFERASLDVHHPSQLDILRRAVKRKPRLLDVFRGLWSPRTPRAGADTGAGGKGNGNGGRDAVNAGRDAGMLKGWRKGRWRALLSGKTAKEAQDNPSALPRLLLFKVFTNTTHLILTSHTHTTCDNHHSLDMPNLIILHILPTSSATGPFLDFCMCKHDPARRPKSCARDFSCTCPFIAKLRPRRLVLGDTSTCIYGRGSGLWTLPIIFPPYIKDVVVYIGESNGVGHSSGTLRDPPKQSDARETWLSKLQPSVETLTLIFSPRPDEPWLVRPLEPLDYSGETPKAWVNSITDMLVCALGGRAQAMMVVGMELIWEDWTYTPTSQVKEWLEIKLKRHLVREMWFREYEARERVEGIRYRTWEEFEADEAGGGVESE